MIEQHPLPLFYPSNARLLMLGSFPPKRERWTMDFYYPNFQNDMWRIFGLAFFGDKDHFLSPSRTSFHEEHIRDFLIEKGIALSDTAREVNRLRDNASDKYLEILKPIDLEDTLHRLPLCTTLVTTGQKATETLLSLIPADAPPVGGSASFTYLGRSMLLYRMPSSSRAYPKPLHEKADVYRRMFEELHLL